MATTTMNGCAPGAQPVLRTPVRIDSPSKTNEQRGGYDLAWTALYTTRAERTDLSGSEALRAMQVTANSMARYTIRRPPSTDIDESMRLVDLLTNRAYNIRNISNPKGDQQRRWLVLLCEYIPGSTGA